MQITSLKTGIVHADDPRTLLQIIRHSLPVLPNGAVLAVSSKIVALQAGRAAAVDKTNIEDLIKQEADLYLDPALSAYGHHFTIKHNTLVGSAGIDRSNADGHYVLWPEDPQRVANQLRVALTAAYGIAQLGVIITDSSSYPMRRGALGLALAHSGFEAVRSYIGQPDLFGRELVLETANISGGLAAAAVLAMGEGNEGTPLALLTDLPMVTFVERDPTPDEIAAAYVSPEDDVFAPFWQRVPWQSRNNPSS